MNKNQEEKEKTDEDVQHSKDETLLVEVQQNHTDTDQLCVCVLTDTTGRH